MAESCSAVVFFVSTVPMHLPLRRTVSVVGELSYGTTVSFLGLLDLWKDTMEYALPILLCCVQKEKIFYLNIMQFY